MLFLVLSIIMILLWFTLIYWPGRKSSSFAKDLPGPFPLPLFGNTYLFLNNNGDYVLETIKMIKKYSSPMKFWLGSHLLIVFSNPNQVEKLLSTTKLAHKHNIYEFFKPYVGEGLISGSGPSWRHARRLLQPLYNIQFVAESTKVFHKHVQLLKTHLDTQLYSGYFNVEPIIHHFCADIIGETILGTQLNTQKGENKEILASLANMYILIISRITKPWLHFNFIFNLTKLKTIEEKTSKHMMQFFGNLAETGKAACYENVTLPVTEENDGFRPSLLDITHRIVDSPQLDDKNLIDNLVTIFAASEDTTTATASAACLCFGMYPEYQEKAVRELQAVLEGLEQDAEITYEHVLQMTYLDMCVKEVLRIFPIAPVILRKTTEDFQIDDLHIPPECAIMISIFNLHMNPNEWEKPMEFHPDHFLPEAVKNRHVFSYIPFSAGPRGCIGKTFAQTSIKLVLANILRRYKIKAEGKYCDIYEKFKADISVRPTCGYPIKLHPRVWN